MVAVFIIIAVIVAFLIFVFCTFRYDSKGAVGEFIVKTVYRIALRKREYKLYNDLMFKFEDGSFQIDHIIASPYGIFVIETKNYGGTVVGYESANKFIQYVGNRKNEFYSPIKQNRGHIYKLKSVLGDYPYTSVVVFLGGVKLNVTSLTFVGTPRESVSYIKSFRKVVLTADELEAFDKIITEAIESCDITVREHVAKLNEKKAAYENALAQGLCPLCGSPLVLRHGKYGDFYGCSSYPKCKFRHNIDS